MADPITADNTSPQAETFAKRYRGIIMSVVLFVVLNLAVVSIVNYYISNRILKNTGVLTLASRQLTFSQRIPLLLHEIEAKAAAQQPLKNSLADLKFSHDLFDSTMKAFSDGGSVNAPSETGEIVLEAINNKAARAALEKASATWNTLTPHIRSVVTGGEGMPATTIRNAVEAAGKVHLKLLAQLNELSTALAKEAEDETKNLRAIQTIATVVLLSLFTAIALRMITRLRLRDDELESNAASIQQSKQSLEQAYENLQQTSDDLVSSGEETDSILSAVEQGLFLLDSDFRIGNKYSTVAEKILGAKGLSGLNLLHFFKPLVTEKEYKTISSFFTLQFDPRKKASQLRKFNPLAEIECQFPTEEGGHKNKVLQCSFQRIFREGAVDRLLVAMSDVTAQHDLEQQLQQAEKKKERQFELVLEILPIPAIDIQKFQRKANDELDRVNAVLKEDSYLSGQQHEILKGHKDKVDRVFRSIHNIKGQAGMLSLNQIVAQCEKIEDELTYLKQLPKISGEKFLNALVGVLDLRNDVDEIDDLIDKIANMRTGLGERKEEEADNRPNLARNLQRMAGTVASRCGNKVTVDVSGASFDKIPDHLIDPIEDSLVQLVRNSVTHGIEKPEERTKKGKFSDGRITIKLNIDESKKPGVLKINYRDDGRGIELKKVQERAIAQGLATDDEISKMSNEQICLFILEPGFSTATAVSTDAGRGVGMDIVKQRIIENLDGDLSLDFREGLYTEFNIEIPIKKSDNAPMIKPDESSGEGAPTK